MALTYAQLDALTTTDAFLSRVRQAVAYHAEYVLNGTPTNLQSNWIEKVFYQGRCNQIAADMARELVQDGAFSTAASADASDITDSAIQGAVDKIVEKYW